MKMWFIGFGMQCVAWVILWQLVPLTFLNFGLLLIVSILFSVSNEVMNNEKTRKET